jgi:hypothetical protein
VAWNIRNYRYVGDVSGICREAPTISHLLFADDSLILTHADKKNAEKLKEILDSYCDS